jgi:hypothetical protein
MNITVYDWHDFVQLLTPTHQESHGSCSWDKKTGRISCLEGKHCIEFVPRSHTLAKEILNSLPLQFALFNSAICGNTSDKIIMPNMFEEEGFQHAVSVLVKCYRHVNPQFKDGKIYAIMGTYVLPYAKKVFQRLLVSQELHPCILFLASKAPISQPQTPPLHQTLYEVHEISCEQSAVPDEVREFAAFLKNRSNIFGDITTCACVGYSFEELAKNPMINYILAQFSSSFYIEETETKTSNGFYLL